MPSARRGGLWPPAFRFGYVDVLPTNGGNTIKPLTGEKIIIIYTVEEYNGVIHITTSYDRTKNAEHKPVIYYNDKLFYGKISSNSTSTYDIVDFYIPFTGAGTLKIYLLASSNNVFQAQCKLAVSARINDRLSGSFVIGEQCLITLDLNGGLNNIFYIDISSYSQLYSTVKKYINDHFNNEEYIDDIAIIEAYFNMYGLFSRKKIWLFMDRRDSAGENAEYLFQYCSHIDDGTEKYFIINEKSPDAARIAGFGTVIDYGSPQHKLLALFAEKFICSFFEFAYEYPYDSVADSDRQRLFRGLVRSKFVYLQHGVYKDDLSAMFNRPMKNAQLIITSSVYEDTTLTSDKYNFNARQLSRSGAPKFDSLYNDVKKKILYMPTWRNDLFINDGVYNQDFFTSEYCRKINEFLNDKRLVAALETHGYELLFRPHPKTTAQLKDYIITPPIMVAPPDMLNIQLYAECSLLITDYSSVMFDFAYLRKPVLYYQSGKHHYETEYFKYDIMGFGENETDLNGIIARIIEYMGAGCRLKPVYEKRMSEFFEYTDTDNCKRAYEAITQMD